MAAGALPRAVTVIDDWDGTWISNPGGTYGGRQQKQVQSPVIWLKNRQLKALNVNRLHPPYSYFHLADVRELRRPPTPKPLPSFVHSLCSVIRDWPKGWERFPVCFAFNYGSCLNPLTLKQEQRDPGRRSACTDPQWTAEFWSEPSISTISPLNTSANITFSHMNIESMFSSYFGNLTVFLFAGRVFDECLSLSLTPPPTTHTHMAKTYIVAPTFPTHLFNCLFSITLCQKNVLKRVDERTMTDTDGTLFSWVGGLAV